ncbi:MAG: hypothetical protein CYG60_01895 [Actinobacteria bacterium]|nr:MAG: hypothetical protein CYG60_01895 [Actinomycetota bacterium]
MTVYTDNGREATITKLERNTMKGRLLLTTVKDQRTGREIQVEDYFAFQARCISKFGLAAGVYVRQLVFWDGKGQDPDGWIYKKEDEMEAETGLRRRAQREARKILTACQVLEEKRKGVPCRLFYRVNLENLAEVLEAPGSTLNQWKRGTKKDPETGKYHRPEDATLNHDYRKVGITDPASEDGITDLSSRDAITDLTREDGITDPASQDGNRDLTSQDGITDPTITESTYRENVTDYAEGSSESSSESSVFQTAANGFSSRPAAQQKDEFISQDQEQDENRPNPTTSFADQRDLEPKELSEVRKILEHGQHGSVALKHYRAGTISAEEVADYVSWEVAGTLDPAPALKRGVRHVLDELADESRAS